MEFPVSAREIAEDIAREINADSGEGSFHGVFVAAGLEPTQAELDDARRKRSNRCRSARLRQKTCSCP